MSSACEYSALRCTVYSDIALFMAFEALSLNCTIGRPEKPSYSWEGRGEGILKDITLSQWGVMSESGSLKHKLNIKHQKEQFEGHDK